ncbi:MAG: S-layer homology domain-containing protein [Eubacteriales bacterium]|jgi:uncharacterized protein YvpB
MRKRMIAMGLVCCVMLSTSMAGALSTDVQRHWSATAVNTLVEHGKMKGYPDGTFRPNQLVTREEAASLLSSFIQESTEEPEENTGEVLEEEKPEEVVPQIQFADVQDRWSEKAIEQLCQLGVTQGMEDGLFHPADPLTREQFSVMLYNLMISNGELEPVEEPEEEESAGTQDETQTEVPQEPAEGETSEPQEGTQTEEPQEEITQQPVEGETSDSQEGTQMEEPQESGEENQGEVTQEAEEQEPSDPAEETTGEEQTEEENPQEIEPVFPDVEGRYGEQAIAALCQQGILKGYPDGTFRPDTAMTRAEIASALFAYSGYDPIEPVLQFPESWVIDVPYISQVYPVYAPVGCEPTSLLMGLKAKGYAQDVGLRQFLDELPRHTSNPAKGFVGSPYTPNVNLRTTIYPAKLAEYGSRYGRVVDISGYSPEQLQMEILSGNPVVAYVTLYWQNPYYRNYNIEGQTQSLLRNNHAVLVCGYDSKTNYYYIADPYNVKNPTKEYFYWIDGETFDRLYNVRRHALMVE